jgi:hypothetical protein
VNRARYSPPHVTDYGTLLELTSHIDVNFTGAVSNLVLAAMSGPLGAVSGTGSGSPGGSGGAGGVTQAAGPHGAGGGFLGLGGGGGKLPFTGFPTLLVAAVGAALASAGATIRMLLRRRRA